MAADAAAVHQSAGHLVAHLHRDAQAFRTSFPELATLAERVAHAAGKVSKLTEVSTGH